jgi:four helix bundle protein
MKVRNFRDLIVWQKAMDFAENVYLSTGGFPKEEIYGLRAQLRAATSSVPANIAEGQGRKTTREFQHFLRIAYGSLCESQTHILLAERLGYFTPGIANTLIDRATEVARLIHALIDSLTRKQTPKR